MTSEFDRLPDFGFRSADEIAAEQLRLGGEAGLTLEESRKRVEALYG